MKEIGATLKKRREELGYTLEEMSNKTRISLAQLKALEEGNLAFFKDDLSYVRYFVRFYCQSLYLDFDPLREQLSRDLDLYTETVSLKVIQDREMMQSNIEKKINKATGKIKQEKRKIDYSLLSLLVVIVIMVVCLGVVIFKTVPSLLKPKEPTPTPVIVATPTPQTSQEPTPGVIESNKTALTITKVDASNYEIRGWKENENISIKVQFGQDTWIRVLDNDVASDNPASKIYNPAEVMEIMRMPAKDLKITIHFGVVKGNIIMINDTQFDLDATVASKANAQKINFILKGE